MPLFRFQTRSLIVLTTIIAVFVSLAQFNLMLGLSFGTLSLTVLGLLAASRWRRAGPVGIILAGGASAYCGMLCLGLITLGVHAIKNSTTNSGWYFSPWILAYYFATRIAVYAAVGGFALGILFAIHRWYRQKQPTDAG